MLREPRDVGLRTGLRMRLLGPKFEQLADMERLNGGGGSCWPPAATLPMVERGERGGDVTGLVAVGENEGGSCGCFATGNDGRALPPGRSPTPIDRALPPPFAAKLDAKGDDGRGAADTGL